MTGPKFKTVIVEKKAETARSIARDTGIGHSTISRIMNGEDFRVSTAKKLLPHLLECPCCGTPRESQS